MRRSLAVFALGALMAACSEQATSPRTAATLSPAAPAFDIANAPDQTGIVVRSDWQTGVIWGSESDGLIALLGTSASSLCQHPDEPWLAEWSTVTYADRIRLGEWLGYLGKARDIPTEVWAYTGGHIPALCASFQGGAAPLATGITRGVEHAMRDNTAFLSYHGRLTRPDDSEAVFGFKLQFDRDGQATVSISLH